MEDRGPNYGLLSRSGDAYFTDVLVVEGGVHRIGRVGGGVWAMLFRKGCWDRGPYHD